MDSISTTFLGASVLASFLGGMLAFMAPCCVSFLFPAYFASAFREKSKIFQMTFIYFLGLALVLVPIGLGVTALSLTISRYHNEVFILGGVFLIILAVMTIFGKTIPMPFKPKSPERTPNKNMLNGSLFLRSGLLGLNGMGIVLPNIVITARIIKKTPPMIKTSLW